MFDQKQDAHLTKCCTTVLQRLAGAFDQNALWRSYDSGELSSIVPHAFGEPIRNVRNGVGKAKIRTIILTATDLP